MAYLVIDIIDVFKGDPFPLIQVLFQLEGVLVKVLLQLLVSEVDTELLETTEEGRRGEAERKEETKEERRRMERYAIDILTIYRAHTTGWYNRG